MESNIASVATEDRVKITFNEISYSVNIPTSGVAAAAAKKRRGPFAKKEMQEKVILKCVSGVRR